MNTAYKPTNLILNSKFVSWHRLGIFFAILTIFLAATGISSARSADYNRQKPTSRSALPQDSSRLLGHSIRNPYNASDYMSRLAGELTPEGRRILLFGFEEGRERPAGSPRRVLSTPREPIEVQRSRVPVVEQIPERPFPPAGVPIAMQPTTAAPVVNHIETPTAPTGAEEQGNLLKSLEEVLARADKLTDKLTALEKAAAPAVVEPALPVPAERGPLGEPEEPIEEPQVPSPTPSPAKAYLVYSPAKEKQDLTEIPKKALPDAGKPIDLGEPPRVSGDKLAPAEAPAQREPKAQEAPKKIIKKPEKPLLGADEPTYLDKLLASIEQAPKQPIQKPQIALTAPKTPIDLEKPTARTLQKPTSPGGEHFKTAWRHAGFALDDVVNVITCGHGSDRAVQFRENDGKNPSSHLEKVTDEGGQTIDNVLNVFYSTGDAVLIDSLPDFKNETYKSNHALLRPCIFSGKTVLTSWKTVENVGNTLTWGYFDNVTGSAVMLIWDIIESLRYSCQGIADFTIGRIGAAKN